jgi:hypothetical protein
MLASIEEHRIKFTCPILLLEPWSKIKLGMIDAEIKELLH